MNITAAMVKELREQTGAGMMDCKKALAETDGDMAAAAEFLRKKGAATAAKKANRIAAEGLTTVLVAEDLKSASVVEVNSETDFVAKNALFQEFVADVAVQALQSNAADMDAFMAETWVKDSAMTTQEALVAKIAVIQEKLSIRRVQKVCSTGMVGAYVHGGGRISVLTNIECDVINDDVKAAAKAIAMQVAAMNPKYNTRDDVDQEFLAHERSVLLEQALTENASAAKPKPQQVIEKMVEGRLNKELAEFVLMDQVFQIGGDGKQTVAQYLADVSKKVGSPVKCAGYVRYETGEGMEKKQENFAEEVAKQMGN